MRTTQIRRGLTLIELLVVMTMMGILAGMVAVIMPKYSESSRVADGSRQMQGWLATGRQKALRDRAPRGLRFTGQATANLLPYGANQPSQYLYNRFVYIEQPEDVTGQPVEIQPIGVAFNPPAPYVSGLQTRRQQLQTHAAQQITQTMAAFPTDLALQAKLRPYVQNPSPIPLVTDPNFGWRYILILPGRNLAGVVRAGDVVEFGSARYSVLIDAVGNYPAMGDSYLVLHRPRDEWRTFAVNPATGQIVNTMIASLPPYRITRAARPIAGEPEVILPRGVHVDILVTNLGGGQPATRSLPAPDVTTPPGALNIDVLFAPSGEVIGGLGSYGKVVLWMRDTSLGEPNINGAIVRGGLPPGDNRLLVIHTRTGNVTAHAVNTDVNANGILIDPYRYVRDGKSSALDE